MLQSPDKLKFPTPGNVGPAENSPADLYTDPHEAVAIWLKEVARRRVAGPRGIPEEPRLSVQREKPASRSTPLRTRYKGLLLLAGLGATYLEYYFFDILLQAASMHSLIVFVLADMH